MIDKEAIAKIWYEMVQSSVPQVFGTNAYRVNDSLAQPGYVGEEYKSGGLLLIGMNPAGDGTGSDNERVYTALRELTGTLETLTELNQTLLTFGAHHVNVFY
jgi:hypothetical protein